MAKFIKSIFQTPSVEKKKNIKHDAEIEGESENPIGDRRKLSMSRSGRLKQAYKKRHSLSLELYGNDDDIQPKEKARSKEYHVHPTKPAETHRKSLEAISDKITSKSPEEEIDSAFEIIDKS